MSIAGVVGRGLAAGVWGSDAALYATLGIAPPPWRWSIGDLATDLYGKGVLAFATSGAYVAISKAT